VQQDRTVIATGGWLTSGVNVWAGAAGAGLRSACRQVGPGRSRSRSRPRDPAVCSRIRSFHVGPWAVQRATARSPTAQADGRPSLRPAVALVTAVTPSRSPRSRCFPCAR
jgi:hypothetical protein